MSKHKKKVNILILKSLLSNEELIKREGEYILESECKQIIKEDTDAYYIDEDEIDGIKNKKKLLFKFRKNVIPNEICVNAYNALENHAKHKNHNRGAAAGKLKLNKLPKHVGKLTKTDRFRVFYKTKSGKVSRDNVGNSAQSNIAGYYDRPDRNEYNKKYNKTKKHNTKNHNTNVNVLSQRKAVLARLLPKAVSMCRTTKFTKEQVDKWNNSLPLIRKIDNLFKTLVPDRYKIQLSRANKTPNYIIKNTAYSTITVNYDWRTAIHRDFGDLDEGFGNLCVLEKSKSKSENVNNTENSYTGGYLGFPRFGVCVDVRQCDFLAMDVHQYHANTELKGKGRLSIVCYLRKKMINCSKIKLSNQ